MKINNWVSAPLILISILLGQNQERPTIAVPPDTTFIFGPLYTRFPPMESLLDSSQHDVRSAKGSEELKEKNRSGHVLSTGSVYRSFMVSPLGANEFTGGLQMQLQGHLSENMQVSGVISDETSPIQPEGNTQSINEIDQVYLNIHHPNFQIDAGDIVLNYDHGKYINIEKRLIGLKNNFKLGKWKGSTVFAGSKGHYHQKEFKGNEGKQGPYFLDSKTGNRNIVVQAGTEKIWLNGERLSRGDDRDYTVDYSKGEVYFTPRNLIHSDSDILIEYQYSDFQYSQSVMGGMLERPLNEKGTITFSWINESDQTKGPSLNLTEEEIELLNDSGDNDAFISGAVEDSLGDYIYVNREYFEYSPGDSVQGERYSVTFINDNENGEYRRSISSIGVIFYEFVEVSERTDQNDLYSPLKRISSPTGQQLFEISGKYQLSTNTAMDFSVAASDIDQNLLSSSHDGNNTGLAYSFSFMNDEIQLSEKIRMELGIYSRNKDDRFSALQRDRSALFYQEWNLDPEEFIQENQHDVKTDIFISNIGQGSFQYINLTYGDNSYDRFNNEFRGGAGLIPHVYSRFNNVNGKSGSFKERTLELDLLPGKTHPFIQYDSEEQENKYRFEHQTIGIKYIGEQWSSSLGVGERIDHQESDSTKAGLERSAVGTFGSFEIKGRNTNGWTQEVIVHRRLKDDIQKNEHYNYSLARIRTSFRQKDHPIRWDLKGTLEETYMEKRALVYDSVGVGFGDHRYDQEFNTYVDDPNGAFIAYTVFTGDREPTSKLEGLQILELDLGKTSFTTMKNISIRSEMRTTMEGHLGNEQDIFYPMLGDSSIVRSQWSFRNEVVHQPQHSGSMVKIWQGRSRHLNGLDQRGHELNDVLENGVDVRRMINNALSVELKWDHHDISIESAISDLRERTVNGQWLEGEVCYKMDQWQLAGALHMGFDSGDIQTESYSADAKGIRMDILRFLGKKGRLHGRVEYYRSTTDHPHKLLPPEALNGLANGSTFRSNIMGSWMIGRGFSVNITLNYLSDARYDDHITFNGEIRAHF